LEPFFWILTLAGIGYLPMGVILSMALGLLWMYMLQQRTRYWFWILAAQIVLTLLLITLGSPLGTEDPGAMVIDEFVAAGILLLAARDWVTRIAGLAIYGILDAIKPVGQYAELLPGALGIVGDDMASAIIASLCILLVRYLFTRHAQGGSV
jgi:phosphatidylglycerophosphatase A